MRETDFINQRWQWAKEAYGSDYSQARNPTTTVPSSGSQGKTVQLQEDNHTMGSGSLHDQGNEMQQQVEGSQEDVPMSSSVGLPIEIKFDLNAEPECTREEQDVMQDLVDLTLNLSNQVVEGDGLSSNPGPDAQGGDIQNDCLHSAQSQPAGEGIQAEEQNNNTGQEESVPQRVLQPDLGPSSGTSLGKGPVLTKRKAQRPTDDSMDKRRRVSVKRVATVATGSGSKNVAQVEAGSVPQPIRGGRGVQRKKTDGSSTKSGSGGCPKTATGSR